MHRPSMSLSAASERYTQIDKLFCAKEALHTRLTDDTTKFGACVIASPGPLKTVSVPHRRRETTCQALCLEHKINYHRKCRSRKHRHHIPVVDVRIPPPPICEDGGPSGLSSPSAALRRLMTRSDVSRCGRTSDARTRKPNLGDGGVSMCVVVRAYVRGGVRVKLAHKGRRARARNAPY